MNGLAQRLLVKLGIFRQQPRRPISGVRRTRLPGGLWVPSESATIRAWDVV